MVNMSQSQHNAPRLTIMPNSSHKSVPLNIPSTRLHSDEYRDLTEEASSDPFLDGTLEDHTVEVPVKKYSPLPDISQSDLRTNTFPLIRTEASLLPNKPRISNRSNMVYHFATTQRGHLPALNKSMMNFHTVNAMDLDEDLPECHTNGNQRTATYTSPGERIQSPIERPPAPSPPSSAQVKKFNSFAFGDDDAGCQLSDTEFSSRDCVQPMHSEPNSIPMSNHRRARQLLQIRDDDDEDDD